MPSPDIIALQSVLVGPADPEIVELRVRRIGGDVAIAALCTRLVVEVNGGGVPHVRASNDHDFS